MLHLPDPGPLVIVGAGGFGRECLDIVEALNREGAGIEFRGFLDDGDVNLELLGARGVRHLGTTEYVPSGCDRFVIGIGSSTARRLIDQRLVDAGLRAETLAHPAATFGSEVSMGDGSVICAGVRLTTNIRIGRHVHLNLNSTVGHDSVIRDFVSVFPGATISGNVTIEEGATVGTGANIIPGVNIGADSFVGAGAVVNRDVPAGATVAGVPARPIGRSS